MNTAVSEPHDVDAADVTDVVDAVLAEAGAFPRDAIDARVVDGVRSGNDSNDDCIGNGIGIGNGIKHQ